MKIFQEKLPIALPITDYKRLYEYTQNLAEELSKKCDRQVKCMGILDDIGSEHYLHSNFDIALVVFRASAQYCNSVNSQFYLGEMYENGHGVEKNLYGGAYYWYFKASENSLNGAKIACERVIRYAAEYQNFLPEKYYQGMEVKMPEFRHAINIQMLVDGVIMKCEQGGCEAYPRDLEVAKRLRKQRNDLAEEYK